MALFGSRLMLHPKIPVVARAQADDQGGSPPPRGKIDFDNILRLIPGEVVPLYIAGRTIPEVSPLLVFAICLLISATLRILATRSGPRLIGVNWYLVCATLFAFILWANAVAAPILPILPQGGWAFLAMAFGIVAPRLVTAGP